MNIVSLMRQFHFVHGKLQRMNNGMAKLPQERRKEKVVFALCDYRLVSDT